MPLYEYQCEACGNRFEQIRKFSDPPLEVCPKCGEPKVQKLLSSPAIQFKGSGWYITDYARKAVEGAKQAESKDGKESKDTKDTKDTKDSKTGSSDSSSTSSSSSADSAPAAPASKDK